MGKGHSRRRVDLTGMRFGKLVAVGPADNIGDRTAWTCRCDCGNTCVVKTYHLRSGHVKSCGCTSANKGPGNALGLTFVDGTCVEMLAKRPVRKNNSSGVTGVERRPYRNSWRASICFKGKRRYLGSFRDFDDAVAARKKAEEELFGRFLAEQGVVDDN